MRTSRHARLIALLRYLRIAWSVGCGIACLLLIALSVRSYWIIEAIIRGSQASSETTIVSLMSNNGTLAFTRRTVLIVGQPFVIPDKWSYHTAGPQSATSRMFDWRRADKGFMVRFPTWLPAIFLAGAAAIPWMGLKWKWSLRTLLIATTLLGLILGTIIATTR